MTDPEEAAVEHRVTEPARTPVASLVLGYGATVPLILGAVGAWILPDPLFLAGVRRGLSFRTVHGPTTRQLAMMAWLFGLGLLALLAPSAPAALLLLMVGYLSLAVLDPPAADRGEVPLFFRALRPPQMTLAAGSLGIVLLAELAHDPP